MRRFISIFVSLLTLLFSYKIHLAHASKIYAIGIYENPPLVFTHNGTPKGFLVDLLNYIASKENIKLSFTECEWVKCLELLDRGEIDLLLPVAFSHERTEKFDFGQVTVFNNWGELYCSKNFRLTSIEDLNNKKIAVVERDIYTEAFQSMISNFGIKNVFYISAKDYEEVFKIIENEEADCGVTSRLTGFALIERYPGVYRTPVCFKPTDLRIAATKGKHTELLNRLDDEIKKIKADTDSIYYLLLDKWIFQTPEKKTKHKWVLLGFAFSLMALFTLALIFKYALSKKTKELNKVIENLQDELRFNEQLKQALELQKRLKQVIIDNLQVGLILADERGKILVWNSKVKEWLNDIEKLAENKVPLWNAFYGLELDIKRLFETGFHDIEQQLEWEIKRDIGSKVIKVSIQPATLENTYAVVLLQDITELREIARFYENRWIFFQQIVDKMPLPLFIIDQNGNVIVWNEASERITGLSKQKVLNRPLDLSPLFFGGRKILIPAILLMHNSPEEIEKLSGGRIKVSSDFDEAVETTGWIWVREEKRYVKILASRLRDPQGNIIGYFQCARDITDEINVQRTLAEVQKAEAISHLTSAFTHELNNLLTIILGACDIISLETAQSPQIEQYLSIIRETVQKGSVLSDYFQKMGRSDESYYEKRVFNDIIQEILEPLKPLLRDTVKLKCQFDPTIGKVRVRRSEFEAIIFRLLIADREELSLPKNIILRTTLERRKTPLITPDVRIPPGDYAVLSITYTESDTDKMPEITENHMQKISFPFINKMVEQAGGYIITYRSEDCVKVELKFPVEVEIGNHLPHAMEILKEKTVLIIEDDLSLVNLLRSAFRLYNSYVIEALSLEEAESKWKKHSNVIDLVILDLVLPNGTTTNIFQIIKNDRPDIPIIFTSGYDRSSLLDELGHENVVFIKKPFTISQIIDAIIKMLHRKHHNDY